jgi:hypothetical protein
MTDEKKDGEDYVDEVTPNEVLPVVQLKGLRDNLQSCIERPQDLTPEAYAQLEEYYARAINASPCPCGKQDDDGKPVPYGECICKKLWWRAKKAWAGRETPEDKQAKQEFRDRMREDRELSKKEKGIQVVCRVGVSADGEVVVLPADGKETYNLEMAQQVCDEAAKQLFLFMVSDRIRSSVGNLATAIQGRLDELGKMMEQRGGFPGL